jgi:hypothetical protein
VQPLRNLILLMIFLGLLVVGWLAWKLVAARQQPVAAADVAVTKLPVSVASHTFDPAAPPPEMPQLAASETAVCDSNFLSSAIVGGQTHTTDATHATLAVTHVKVTLQLTINLWLPAKAPQILIDHEEGHRQISENIYQTADKLIERIAAAYIGKRVEITGTDFDAESRNVLHQLASEITDEYNRELSPNRPQLLYDSITDHARNGVIARDAVDHVLKNASVEAADPPAAPRN